MSTAVLQGTRGRSSRVLLPFRHTDWQSRVLGVALTIVPPLGTTVWLAATGGHLAPILVLIGCIVALFGTLSWLLVTARIELTPTGLRRWSVPARDQRINRSDVARVVVVPVFVRDSLKTTRRLFLVGHDGRTLVQMSERWWPHEAIAAVARHFEVQPETIAEPLTAAELRRTGLVKLVWHEQHPALAAVAGTVLIAVFSAAATYVTSASV